MTREQRKIALALLTSAAASRDDDARWTRNEASYLPTRHRGLILGEARDLRDEAKALRAAARVLRKVEVTK